MNEVLRQLYNRKSVRAYEERPISDEDRRKILEGSIQAPTAGNMSLYTILDITDQALKDRLAVTCDNQPFIAKAPMVLVFLADYQRWYDTFLLTGDSPRPLAEGDLLLAICDALIAAQNAVVAAQSLGVGSCYIGDIMECYETHRDLLSLPRYALPVAMVCFGYPTAQQLERTKPSRFQSRYIVHQNGYRSFPPAELRKMHEFQTGKHGDALDQHLHAFFLRKYESDFSREMSRSVREMLRSWTGDAAE